MTAAATYIPNPVGVAWDQQGGFYLSGDDRVVHVNASGVVDKVIGNGIQGFAGDGGPASASSVGKLNLPTGLAVGPFGNLFIADQGNQRVREVSTTGAISTYAGTGNVPGAGDACAATSAFLSPSYLTCDNGWRPLCYRCISGSGPRTEDRRGHRHHLDCRRPGGVERVLFWPGAGRRWQPLCCRFLCRSRS